MWLILATNSGTRLAALIAGAGLFGWMTIMGSVWWIYGKGWAGDAPHWELVQIVDGELDGRALEFASLDSAKDLRSEDLPIAYELVVAAHDDLVDTYGDSVFAAEGWEPSGVDAAELTRIEEIRTAWAEFGAVTVDDLTPEQTDGKSASEIEALAIEEDARNQVTTLSELKSVAPDLIPDEKDVLGRWRLLATSEMGEAQASAIAFLLEDPDHGFDNQDQFKILDGFNTGGKRKLPEDPDVFDRIYQKFATALTIKNPTVYGIVQVQAVTPESLVNLPGRAPQRTIADPGEPVVSVVMIRNLGNLRVKPAMVTIGSLCIFLAFCYMLHERDKVAMARQAEITGAR
ncbi:MAG: hypothetical protein R2695_07210 [Acidimicrobiales bacterium]